MSCFSYPNLAYLLSNSSPTSPMTTFWKIFRPLVSHLEPPLSQKYDRLSIREIQKKMVLACYDYEFAMDAWGLMVAPFLLGLPRIGNITSSTKKSLVQMHSPVLVGSLTYVDTNTYIVSLGELSVFPLTGIRTSKVDAGSTSSKYLNFLVNDPCTVLVCWPEKCKTSKWLSKRGYFLTTYKVTTSSTTMIVFAKQISVASIVSLGGCANALSNENYFVLISRSFYPSYAKMKSDELVRFQLSKVSNNFQEIGSIRIDTSLFQWGLHLDTNISDMNQLHLPESNIAFVESIPSPSTESLFPLFARTRLSWEFSGKLGTLELQYSNHHPRLPIFLCQGSNLCLIGEMIHIDGTDTGVIPRLDRGSTRLQFDLLAKSCCSPSIVPEETKLEIGTWLSTSLEFILEPTSIVLDITKYEGRSNLLVKFDFPQHINVNILPWQFYALYNFTVPIFKYVTEKSEAQMVEFISSKPTISSIIFENKLGQDIHLKLERHNENNYLDDEEDDHRVFRCSISSDSAVQVQLPITDDDILQHLSFNIETFGWSSLENILLSSVESHVVYPIHPQHILTRSRTNSYCTDEVGDQNGFTWHNSLSDDHIRQTELRYPLSKKISTLIDEFSMDKLKSCENVYGITVQCKLVPSTSQDMFSSQSIVDCGLIFGNDNIELELQENNFSDSRNISKAIGCTLHVTLSSNIYLLNSSECSLSVTVADDLNYEIESKEVIPLPLLALHPTNSFINLQKVWGLDKWLPDPFDFHVSQHSFNIDTPARLRISRDQENQSIWISALENSMLLGSTSVQSSRPSSLFPGPLEDIEESSDVSINGDSLLTSLETEEVKSILFFVITSDTT